VVEMALSGLEGLLSLSKAYTVPITFVLKDC
jgi:hypothetical protein